MNAGILEKLKKEYKSLLIGMGIGSRSANFIGLDIGSRHFRAVRVKKTGDGFSVLDTLVDSIEKLGNFPVKMAVKDDEEVCVNLNSEGVIIKRLSIPVMPHEEIESALRWELKEGVDFDIDKAKIKFNVLGEKETEDGAKKIELIVFAYQELGVESKVKQLKEIGLNVQNVVPLDFALARYLSNSKIIPENEKAAIVDIGSVKTIISIIEKGRVYFTRDIAIGGDAITEAMTGATMSEKGRMELSRENAEKMKIENGIPDDMKALAMIRPILEKLASQIKSSLEYYEQHFHEKGVKRIILAGNGSRLKGLREYIIKETGVEVLAILPEEAGAIGLALSTGLNLNMLPEKFRSEGQKALKRFSVRLSAIILAGILLFSYALLCIQAINLTKGAEIQRQHWNNLREIKILKDKIIAYKSVIDTISLNGINAGNIMKETSKLILSDMALDRFTIDSKEPNIRIGGVVFKQDSLTEFMSKLESSPLFQNVKLSFSEKSQSSGSPDAATFEITANIAK
ncbi:MAG: pilus assembly protein PilM [Candidatus Omnitrophica bacterium]|nr:pilus assembly protein PilM [Candidatus Omnitrophota bacterium]